MASSTTDPRMDKTDRNVLDHFKEGLSPRTIASRLMLEVTDVQATITELAGGDRTKAAALVVDYDKAYAGTPETPLAVTEPARKPATRKPSTPAPRPAPRTPAPAHDPIPAELSPAEDPVDLDAVVAAAPAGDTAAAAWDGLDRAITPVLVAALAEDVAAERGCTHGDGCPVHPDVRALHNFDNRAVDVLEAALSGPTDPLPAVSSFEELLAGVEASADPELRELAHTVTGLVDQLHDGYARVRRIRFVRAEAVTLRRQLAEHLAMLARLEAGDVGNNPPAPAIRAAA